MSGPAIWLELRTTRGGWVRVDLYDELRIFPVDGDHHLVGYRADEHSTGAVLLEGSRDLCEELLNDIIDATGVRLEP